MLEVVLQVLKEKQSESVDSSVEYPGTCQVVDPNALQEPWTFLASCRTRRYSMLDPYNLHTSSKYSGPVQIRD
jgi:hypothetical protein